ncbi:hypothetical protein QQP08_025303 [Theobroma cacao]|nr:hypothetical protein QQP08_025303 [Theobroma cacao]
MGSSSSRLGSNPSRGRLNHRPKWCSRLSSLFICGGSSSQAPLETGGSTESSFWQWVEHLIIVAPNLGPPREQYEVFIEDARVKL